MAAKPILISRHARFEMGRRSISPADVQRMLRSPGQVVPSVKGRSIYQGFVGRSPLLLRVIVKEDARAYHVVTAYRTSNIAKYWRTP